jgi:Arc/MetJ-type ribon-helix-helix transcriptional regulator
LLNSIAADDGMVIGMATKKVTITLEAADLDRIRDLVADGSASSVSGFVQHAVGVALDDVAGWGAMLAEALAETGGPMTPAEAVWANEVLGITPKTKRAARKRSVA